jgi:hypothetical protein
MKMEEIFSAVALLVSVLVLAAFYNLCRRVGQIRDGSHAIRITIEEELKRAAQA